MPFKITARTILQLGAELISSDAIAFYELIKNAFDAKSKRVTVRVVIRFEKRILDSFLEESKIFKSDAKPEIFREFKERVLSKILSDTYNIDLFKEKLDKADSIDKLKRILQDSNYILISDSGDGMSLDDLEDIFLTIGTTNRRKQRKDNPDDVVLGEKGLGRLSVMRLGDRLKVETSQAGDPAINVIDIDWTAFSHDSDALLDSIDIKPYKGKTKENISDKGTKIFIYSLKSDWSKAKLEDIAEVQLSRFTDPFARKHSDFIRLKFNDEPIVLSDINRKLFGNAHAIVKAKLYWDDGKIPQPIFAGSINYRLYEKETTFKLEKINLLSILEKFETPERTLTKLGPFQVEFYWYNRQILNKDMGLGDQDLIKDLVKTWGGGLMVYRDGFRVNPYGSSNDDWLELDPRAFKMSGYKLNRKQVIGKVDISSTDNPELRDQTNREGLRENDEKKMLVVLLQHIMWQEVVPFLNEVNDEQKLSAAVLDMDEIEKRIELGQNQVRHAVDLLKERHPVIQQETKLLKTIEDVLKESSELFAVAKLSSEELDERLKTTLDLAGLGLMVDVIAHELNRATRHALDTLNTLSDDPNHDFEANINTLRSQLKTLQTRLKVIDPLGPSGRQQKVLTDLKGLIRDTVNNHKAQFARHHIVFSLEDTNASETWNLKVVPGMVVQILENLISNSVYWIKHKQTLDQTYKPTIEIHIDRKNEIIAFSDNGPGIARDRKEKVFLPFVSTKPPGDGKGLGLYISKELALYHRALLYLDDDTNADYLNTFVLVLNQPK